MKKVMPKILLTLVVSFTTLSASFAYETTFSCKESGARFASILTVSATSAEFNGEVMKRDLTYRPSVINSRMQRLRYKSENMTLVVPVLMVRNKTNRGNIVVISNNEAENFHCLK